MPRTYLLIGGNSGIGLATARLLQSRGNSILAASRTAGPLTESGIPVQPFDAASPAPLDLPPVLDGLAYFPGSITLKPFHRLTREDFFHDLQVNLMGAVFAIQSALPSLTDTPLAATLLNSDGKREASAKRHPLQQIGNPDDLAALVAFLLSDAARFITGQILRPDGGLSSIRTF
jgi:3-oxoacyl-[acyl-carrier protein] reductase